MRLSQRNIDLKQLFILTFSSVGASSCGTEALVSSGGIILAIVGTAVFPFFWGLVEALCATELSVRYKSLSGGLPTWLIKTFNDKALAFLGACFIIIINCSVAAFAAESSVAYINTLSPIFATYWTQYGLTSAFIVAAAAINRISIGAVTRACWLFTFNTITCFAVFAFMCIPKIDASRYREHTTFNSIKWSEFVNLLVFNSAGYDVCSSVVDRIVKPKRTIPRSVILTVVSISAMYIFTLVCAYGADVNHERSDWEIGHFSIVARDVGGSWLQVWLVVSCILSNLQMTLASTMTGIYTIEGASQSGMFPRWLARPENGVIGFTGIALLAAFLPYKFNMSLQSILYALVMLATFSCIFACCFQTKFVPRELWKRILLFTPPIILSFFIIFVQSFWVVLAVFGSIFLALIWSYLAGGAPPPPPRSANGAELSI